MGFKESSWISGKEFLSFTIYLLISRGLRSTKEYHFLILLPESEKEQSNKQGASKFSSNTSKPEMKNVKKSSVI